jgi:hypothetical protein
MDSSSVALAPLKAIHSFTGIARQRPNQEAFSVHDSEFDFDFVEIEIMLFDFDNTTFYIVVLREKVLERNDQKES